MTWKRTEASTLQLSAGYFSGLTMPGWFVDFAVGPSGVGPVMGVDSGDFFPSAPDADLDSNRTGESDTGVQ